MNTESLEKLKELEYGWITPLGDIFACKMYSHMSVIFDNNIISEKLRSKYKTEKDYVNDVVQGCEELASRNEHPEWHNYEMAKFSFESDMISELYSEGFIRIGFIKYNQEIELEGRQFSFTKHANVIETLKDYFSEFKINMTIKK